VTAPSYKSVTSEAAKLFQAHTKKVEEEFHKEEIISNGRL